MKSSYINIYSENDKLTSTSNKSYALENEKKLGEKKEGKIHYSIYEAMLLFEKYNANVMKKNKTLGKENLMKIFSKNIKRFHSNYLVFKHLRNKGYIVKEGLKFGGDFRIYEKHNLSHAKYICLITNEERLKLKDLISKVRITHSTAKKLLLAIVDREDDLLFYEIDWIKI